MHNDDWVSTEVASAADGRKTTVLIRSLRPSSRVAILFLLLNGSRKIY